MKLFKTNEENVLVIGDSHIPFQHPDYLAHCIDTYKKYKCTKVIMIGDLIDQHAQSRFPSDPDGLSAGDEMKRAIIEIKKYYKAFPKMTIILGNHDKIVHRQLFSIGLSSKWVREFSDILETPGWEFVDHLEYNGVLFVHGEGATNILNTVKETGQSVCAGHTHTKAEVLYSSNGKNVTWGMHTGCGISEEKYAFAYGKHHIKKPILSCGVVLNNGKLPIVIPMPI